MDLGRVGIWTFQFDYQPIDRCIAAAREIEELGFGTLWVPEQRGREAISLATLLLSSTERIVIANGIARASARDARSMAAAQLTLAEAFPDRYLLGVGGQTRLDGDSVEALGTYLDAMDVAEYAPPVPSLRPPRVLAAINRRGLKLAAARSLGAHTYLCPPRHIRWARKVLGPTPLLAVEQPVVLESGSEIARTIARRHLSFYLALPAYRQMLIRSDFQSLSYKTGETMRSLMKWWSGATKRPFAPGSPNTSTLARRMSASRCCRASRVAFRLMDGDEWPGWPESFGTNSSLRYAQLEYSRNTHLRIPHGPGRGQPITRGRSTARRGRRSDRGSDLSASRSVSPL
ncbi:MAG: LLM class flavin-dependent oxidoreductase [Acidimicrobiia bacterium]|nr:LLM class flavin-dependent oxidoreductase [Acidimicrobiia bacterium]